MKITVTLCDTERAAAADPRLDRARCCVACATAIRAPLRDIKPYAVRRDHEETARIEWQGQGDGTPTALWGQRGETKS